ncbi:MAG: T9SS type A sorting domain-containing protein, partial [Schleiferiaceae bacterium]|nr:T9SS type A sorting domain-containing protein [Schleiferiaceae bacterium]
EDGYNNAAQLSTTLYSQIKHEGKYTRNIHPIRGAHGIAETQYFMSNRNFDITNDTVFVMEMVGEQGDPNSQLIVNYGITDVAYGMPPNGQQEDTDLDDPTSGLQTNDARVLGGFLLDGKIQFVANTINPETGRAAFYHGFIENPESNKPTITGNIIGSDTLDYGYPNIAFSGKEDCEQQAIIGFDFSSINDHPGVGAIYFNNAGEYSDLQILVKGETYVDRLGPPSYVPGWERWGDYFGIQRKFNQPGAVYCNGYYGRGANTNSIWTSEVFSPDTNTTGGAVANGQNVVFPNPTNNEEYVNVQFSLDKQQNVSAYIYDMNGRIVEKIVEHKDCVGTNVLSFSTFPLESGTYVVKLLNEGGAEILSEKFIKN